jgi:septum formation protein
MILASQSPRRRELLADAGFSFTSAPSPFDEAGVTAPSPEELAGALARGKAGAVAATTPDVVIGSDTVVAIDGQVLGKPADDADARRMLRLLSGRTHTVFTGVSVWRDGAEAAAFTERCAVTFWDLDDAQIDAYVACGEPHDKAGAYGIQGKGRLLVRGIEGDFYTVMGLPIARLVRELHTLGIDPA